MRYVQRKEWVVYPSIRCQQGDTSVESWMLLLRKVKQMQKKLLLQMETQISNKIIIF